MLLSRTEQVSLGDSVQMLKLVMLDNNAISPLYHELQNLRKDIDIIVLPI